MRLRDTWLRFVNWLGENVAKPVDDHLSTEVTGWVSGEYAAKETEVKEAEKYSSILLSIAASMLEAKSGMTGGPAPTQSEVVQAAGELEAGGKFLAVAVVVGLILKKVFS